MAEAPDPWKIDYFAPPTPHVPAPSPRTQAPKLLPEVDRLFQVQRNSLKVLKDLEEVQHLLRDHKDPKLGQLVQRLGQDAENTYRVIRSYLDKFAQ